MTDRFASIALASGLAVGLLAAAPEDASAQLDLGAPADDVWAYDNAQDPGGDPVARVWGAEGNDINPFGYPCGCQADLFFSYGFFSWDLSDVPPGYEWNGATVTFTVAEGSVYDPETNDVFLRVLEGPFDEDTWRFGVGPGPIDGENNRLVGDDSDVVNGEGSQIVFEIPANVPPALLRQWARNGRIDLALTSTADFAANGEFLRVATKENLLFSAPQLVLD